MNWLLFLKNEMKIDWSHPEDILGIWQSEKGYCIQFQEDKGLLYDLDPLKYPKKLTGYSMYNDLSYVGFGEWKAKRFNWKYPLNGDVSDGEWMLEGEISIQLTSDKNTISDNWRTFKKIS